MPYFGFGHSGQTGLPASYDTWRTASPHDDAPTTCECGHDLDDHEDTTDHRAMAQRRKDALEAIRNLHHGIPNKEQASWSIDDWLTWGLGACNIRGCECGEPQEAEGEDGPEYDG